VVTLDRQGLEVLDLDTCLRLAAAVPVGRVAFEDGGEVIVLPVNHVLDEGGVAFRVATGSTFDKAIMERPMTFQADAYDATDQTGWSVLVMGRATYVDDPEVLARLEEHDLQPWSSPELRTAWVLLTPTRVSGRRVA
jgi:nitroimidazol reductase NimA-like FMN-containing flavoprotein (pyridoxamine 5'-phosphate oxidase superfamily)